MDYWKKTNLPIGFIYVDRAISSSEYRWTCGVYGIKYDFGNSPTFEEAKKNGIISLQRELKDVARDINDSLEELDVELAKS